MHITLSGIKRRFLEWRWLSSLLITLLVLGVALGGPASWPTARAQEGGGSSNRSFSQVEQADPIIDEQVEQAWKPDYLDLATGDPQLFNHGVYAWPFDLNSIGWSMQSYQDYGGTPYFHHGMDMMKMWGTDVYNRSGGKVINIENYQPGWDLYWEVAILDPDGYIWQYHHINEQTIPQLIWNKWYEYQVDPSGGNIPADTYIGDIIEWPVWSFYDFFNHIHLNILAAGGVYVNGFEFHNPLPDTDGPEIQGIGLLQNGQIYPGNSIEGNYSLYVHARDLILDQYYYLPPWEITFSVDCGPVQTTWRFDTLPGGADDTAYLDDFYVVPPTCGDYECREYYIDLGFIRGSQFQFPSSDGEHTVHVTVRDYAGNSASQSFTYNVIGQPNQTPTAYPQSVGTAENMDLGITLTGSDPDHDPLNFTITSTPAHGTLTGTAPDLVYAPDYDYFGADSFTFTVDDCQVSSEPAQVDIEVGENQAPVADPQSVSTLEDTPLDILLTGSDPDGNPIMYTVTSDPTHGMLSGSAPDLTYSPAANFSGSDSFTFLVSDGHESSAPAEVSIGIAAVNDAPLADPQAIITRQSSPLPFVLTGSDIDSPTLTFSVTNPPAHGALSGIAPDLVYIPANGYYGTDSLTFVVNDGELDSVPAEVTIRVNPVIFISLLLR